MCFDAFVCILFNNLIILDRLGLGTVFLTESMVSEHHICACVTDIQVSCSHMCNVFYRGKRFNEPDLTSRCTVQ